jgi:DNA-binding NarL/FixJ family response regulator
MNVLFLDDCPNRTKIFKSLVPFAECVETATEALAALPTRSWDLVLLDHDLGGETFVDPNNANTGMEVARWLVANPTPIRLVVLHSLNAPARRQMHELLSPHYITWDLPFAWKMPEIIDYVQ